MVLENHGSVVAMSTTVQLDDDLWKELNQRKNPGDTMSDVVRRMVEADA
jgi:predicted CopG family antitoxin